MARQGWLALLVLAGLTASNNRQTSFACATGSAIGQTGRQRRPDRHYHLGRHQQDSALHSQSVVQERG